MITTKPGDRQGKRGPRVTWQQLVRREPRLGELLRQARAVRAKGKHFCANAVWYAQFKPRLCRLVGWARRDEPILGTMEAYDVAHETVYEALPGCRDCLCLRLY
jgi:hypothetical protein